jgi:hypothetical protein
MLMDTVFSLLVDFSALSFAEGEIGKRGGSGGRGVDVKARSMSVV